MDNERIMRAMTIALEAHDGQFRADKDCTPYIQHPRFVMNQVETESEKICAILHDVFEDSDFQIEQVAQMVPLTQEEIEALMLLTRAKEEIDYPYADYIRSIKRNDMARKIKIEDLKHNLSTLEGSNFKDWKKAKLKGRYCNALKELE